MHETRTILIGLDLAIIFGGILLSAYQRGVVHGIAANTGMLFAQLVAVGLVWVALSFIADIYDVSNTLSWTRSHRATIAALACVLVFRDAYWGSVRFNEVPIPIWSLPVFLIFALRTLNVAAHQFFPLGQRALIFGAGESGQALAASMVGGAAVSRGYSLVGFVDDDPAKQGLSFCGTKVLGTSHDMMRVISEEGVDILVLAINSSPIVRAQAFPNLLDAREAGVKMISFPTMYEYITRKVAVEHVGTNYGVYFPLEDYRQPFLYDVVKRINDIAWGIFGSLLFIPVVPLIMLGNQVFGNRGPLIYKQTRVGRGGKPFRIYKLRSMVVDAEKAGAQWATSNDPRITKFGNFLRRTRLDEIPQFWNVLKGDMSLIGPRPERPEFISRLEKAIPMYRARHSVKPGLTGWAQVEYRYGASEEDTLVKLQYDLYYIKHRSVFLDFRIVFKTVFVVLGAKGR